MDSNKIGIIGGSYGGYMVLAALTFQPKEFDVGVDLFGISNWVRTLESIPPWWEAFKEALYIEMGNPETQKDYLYSISPLFHYENIHACEYQMSRSIYLHYVDANAGFFMPIWAYFGLQ